MRGTDRAGGALGAVVCFALILPATAGPNPTSPDPTPASPTPASPAPLSPRLANKQLRSPMPGGQMAGYYGDTGLDIAGRYQPVYAIAAGTLDYAERGHTVWRGPRDTDYCVRIELDEPIPYRGRRITHLYYAHLSAVAFAQAEGATPRRHVEAGERLGVSGIANGVPHLHLGLILDGRVDQEYYADVLREWEVRAILGGYRKGARLPSR
jgi:murein DD-endopeptidase MepM/ murein hydrolase activator NlpD